MWQTLETKAKFIHQVMSGDSTIRRLEDIDTAALTYAEVKAIAFGNPLVIEKAKIDAELLRLTRLQCQHRETQFRLRSTLRRMTEDVPIFQKRLAAVQTDLAARQETRGDAFTIEIEGQHYKDRGIAGELLLRRAERLRGTGLEKPVGKFAGFELLVASSAFDGACVLVKGAGTYTAKVADTAHGTIRSLEHTVSSLDETAIELNRNIADTDKRLRDLEPKIGVPFEYADQLGNLTERQQHIVNALDLTHNQAPSQLDTAPEDTEESTNTVKETHSVAPKPRKSRGVRV